MTCGLFFGRRSGLPLRVTRVGATVAACAMTPREIQQSLVLAHFRQTNVIFGRVPPELRGIDTRALRADAYRALRLAQSVLEALPCFAVWFLAQPRAWDRAAEFPHSAEFEAVVRARRDLLEAGAAFLLAAHEHAALGDVRELLALDLALAAAERESTTARPLSSDWRFVSLAPGVRVLSVHPRVVAWHTRIREDLAGCLGKSLWERIWACASGASASAKPPGTSAEFAVEEVDRLLIVGQRGSGATVEKLEAGLAGLLEFVGRRRARPELMAFLAEDMAEGEAVELVESLAEEGLLISRPDGSP
jgi:hypothetical protein